MINIQYFGGKTRTAKDIVQCINNYRNPNQDYIEPFVGGGIILSKISDKRIAYDKHPYLIAMYNELQKGWIPPDNITKEEYYYIKNNKDEKPYLTGFVGFGCSFAGKWFGGYASNARGDNYCLNSKNSILRKMNTLNDVHFEVANYKDLIFKDSLVYCDPPYQGTTQYGLVGEFNSNEFWDTMRIWSQDNTVIISEYNAPDDFKCVWERKTKTEIRNSENIREDRVERLYTYN